MRKKESRQLSEAVDSRPMIGMQTQEHNRHSLSSRPWFVSSGLFLVIDHQQFTIVSYKFTSFHNSTCPLPCHLGRSL
jgi:hypothetical protein